MSTKIISVDLGGVNAFLMSENGKYALVDTGGPMLLDKEYTDRKEVLEAALVKNKITEDNLELIILTHGDVDHAKNAKYISEKYHTPIAMHEADLEYVESPTDELVMKGVNYRSVGLKIVARFMNKLIVKGIHAAVSRFVPFTPDILFKGEEDLKKYGFSAQVLEFPGHTPGSIGIFTEEKELICGDLFSVDSKGNLAASLNAVDFEKCDESEKKARALNPTKVYPGHGNAVKIC